MNKTMLIFFHVFLLQLLSLSPDFQDLGEVHVHILIS